MGEDRTVNLNDDVWVRLTPQGVEHLRKFWTNKYKRMTPDVQKEKVEREMQRMLENTYRGWVSFRLFELMFYFGDSMFGGSTERMFTKDVISLTPMP